MASNYANKMISFREEYHEEYLYLCSQSNASGYVCELIRRDMLNRQNLAGMSEEKIESIIVRVLGQYGLIGGVGAKIEDIDSSIVFDAMDLLEG